MIFYGEGDQVKRGKQYCDDERVIAAFLNNFRMIDVIRETGLSKTTVYRVKNDPEFQKVLRERKEAILKAAVNRMQGYLVNDVEILQGIIEDPDTAAQTRVNAIQILMNQLRDWTTITDITARLSALQETTGDVSGGAQ